MRMLVCGSRDMDSSFIEEALDQWVENNGVPHMVITGGARGVDTRADRWAKTRGCFRAVFEVSEPTWRRFGKKSGPIRNRLMLEMKPDLVLAFPGGKGTENMLHQALKAGVRTIRVLAPDGPGYRSSDGGWVEFSEYTEKKDG